MIVACRWAREMCAWLLAGFASVALAGNLLRNPGFEEALEPVWQKRTPEDAARKLYRVGEGGRSGAGAVLENVVPAYTRLRQGHDRSISVEAGSLVELAAWIRSELDTNAVTTLQLYCMDTEDGILSQPTSRPIFGACDWTQVRLRTQIPDRTAYVMVYLQTRNGAGRVMFDDVALTVKRAPVPRVPPPRIALFTDLSATNVVIQRARVLFEEGLILNTKDPAAALSNAAGALVLYQGNLPSALVPELNRFAQAGGRVFMDMRAFARSRGVEARMAEVGGVAAGLSWQARMAAGLRVVKEGDATAGFRLGQIMPRAGWPDGKLAVLPSESSAWPGIEVLAVAPGGEPGLVRQPVGKGAITACDLLSLREPYCRHVDAYYAFTPVSGALGNPVRFGEYYEKRLSYEGVVEEMRRLAQAYPNVIRLEEEGEASDGNRIWSLNLGKPDEPIYFLYAAAHVAEWEPCYGLITFARRLAEGRLRDVVDLERVRIKILPLLNPYGYEKMRRHNARGVDLNRQGDFEWERFSGRDSNKDGVYGPNDFDWKGTAPFSEPEARVYRKIVSDPALFCLLDFHGNSGANDNKLAFHAFSAHPDNELKAWELQRITNERLRGRHLLRQNDETFASCYLLERVYSDSPRPTLQNTGARGRFGLLIELTAIYPESYGTLLQTDVTCEMCRALFLAYPPPQQ